MYATFRAHSQVDDRRPGSRLRVRGVLRVGASESAGLRAKRQRTQKLLAEALRVLATLRTRDRALSGGDRRRPPVGPIAGGERRLQVLWLHMACIGIVDRRPRLASLAIVDRIRDHDHPAPLAVLFE